MHKFFLFSLLLFGMLPSTQAQRTKLAQADSMGLAILKQHSFLPSNFIILDSLSSTDIGNYNQEGIPVGLVGSDLRVTAITLPGKRAVNLGGSAPILDLDSIALAFRGDGLSYVGTIDISDNALTGSFNMDWQIDSLKNFYSGNSFITNVHNLVRLNKDHLRDFRVDNNNISTLPIELFTSCPNIENIGVHNNPIAQLPPPNVIDTTIALIGSTASITDISYYSGLSNLAFLTLNNMQLTGTFHIEHFLGAQLALAPQDRRLKEFRIHNDNPTNTTNNNKIDNISKVIAHQLIASNISISFISFPEFSTIDGNIRVEHNALDFDDLNALLMSVGIANTDTEISDTFSYAPQDSIGVGGIRRRGLNMPLNFQLETEDVAFTQRNNQLAMDILLPSQIRRNNYEWFWGDSTATPTIYSLGEFDSGTLLPDTPIVLVNQPMLELRDSASGVTRPTLGMLSNQALHKSFVVNTITNPRFPNLILYSRPKTIIVGDCLDSLGQVIQCQELSVQFDDTTSAAVRQLRRAEFGATVVESCVCGKIELWALPDTFQRVSMEANGAGTRIATGQASTKPGLKSADPNYPLLWTNGGIVDTTPNMANVQGNRNTSRTLVAIIDSGSDPDHPLLSANLRVNVNETLNNGIDDDGNCITNDIVGYNFLDRNNIAYDDHGHGTRVAGILAGYGSPSLEAADTSIAILPIKYTNRLSQGTSFEAACAIYYAADYHVNNSNGNRTADSVRVINASWGYQGEYCQILHDAIDYAGKNCGVLFVCSAGNESADNNQVAHYPSNFELDNILAVASSEANGNSLSTYSNYGATTVDIAAPGTYTNTLVPQIGISPNTSALATSGTSFAAPYVSRAAGILFNRYPDASYESVKRALMATATPINGADSAKIYSRGIVNLPAALAYLDTMTVRNVCSHVVAVGTDITYLGEQAKAQTVFPNPVSNAVQIIFAVAPENDVQIQVLDLKGTVILQKTMQGQAVLEVSMQNIPQGFYILQVRDGSTLTSHKIVKM